ncbi:hypothetical protein KUTeg_001826 [Tegillarca granosa]|uniref:Eukaryotic translation initiation factor 5A n=1 Tax=Tegillarca granosa TaxID=220873 RepID=A0ABQ9FSJ4_TEGGR|nr:hypothetical protein KUTeg_001826 [Tegillarca granosa]
MMILIVISHKASSGASDCYPAQCSSLRKGGFVLLKGRPCKIVEMSTSKTGKHGHAKVHLVGIDIFTQKKYEDICPSTHNMSVPHVNRTDFQLVDIEDDFCNLMDDEGNMKNDIKLPDGDLGKEIKSKFEDEETIIVSVVKSMNIECICGMKRSTDK